MTRNNPLVMQGVRRLVANVVGRGFVLDSDSGDKGIDDVNGYRWAEWNGPGRQKPAMTSRNSTSTAWRS